MRHRLLSRRLYCPGFKFSLGQTSLCLLGLAARVYAYDAVICGTNGYSESKNASLSYTSNSWNPVGSGFQCMSINNDPPSFDATWSWSEEPGSVHSYPHVTFESQKVPVPLDSISSLELSVQWSYNTGNDATSSFRTLALGLGQYDTVANVAFDMFADSDVVKAQSATTAETEIMIWIGTVGSPWPIGYSKNRTCFQQELGGVNFTLYTGLNSNNASVFTWLATGNQTAFFEDVSPLLQYLWRNELIAFDSYLGLVEFGSEAYHAGSNVTLSASNFSMVVEIGNAPQLSLNEMPQKCSNSAGGYILTGQLSFCIILTCLLCFF